MAEKNIKDDSHLDIYLDRYELHQNDSVTIYYEGCQNETTQKRYKKIKATLKEGYLDDIFREVKSVDFEQLSEGNKLLLKKLVDGITSEVGRALVGVTFLQLTIKSITPEQSIRLHKGTTRKGTFSWVDGVSMRMIDTNYITPFLRKQGLLNMNQYGGFMTRTLAENYPYSKLYKADMRGPFDEWIDIVDAIENQSMPAQLGLCYLIVQLKNKSDAFKAMVNEALDLVKKYKNKSFENIKELMKNFFNDTDYSARAFEIVIHSFMQALSELNLIGDLELVPLSQMRSANKKHGNVGDVELKDGGMIVEAWDAKYGKPYLRDELEELLDKIIDHPEVKVAGFIVDSNPDRRKDVLSRMGEIVIETGVDIQLLSFDEWIQYQITKIPKFELDIIAERWLVAVVESLALSRLDIAPIDEPCDAWLKDLIGKMKREEVKK